MSDPFFDAERLAGNYPPKGWGWKESYQQRELLESHFAKGGNVEPWMIYEARRLGIFLSPQESAE
jgi:hypothetical protein